MRTRNRLCANKDELPTTTSDKTFDFLREQKINSGRNFHIADAEFALRFRLVANGVAQPTHHLRLDTTSGAVLTRFVANRLRWH
jgi:hypothetical protein